MSKTTNIHTGLCLIGLFQFSCLYSAIVKKILDG